MESLRKYGRRPFSVVVVHGGPGAGGEMAAVASELASSGGVLEPIQTERSLEGQIEELRIVLEKNADPPVTLIGFSWGAWLSFLLAAHFPKLTKKLVLIGSGPFEEKYVAGIQETRMKRLSQVEKAEINTLTEVLDNPVANDKRAAFARLGALFSRVDAYDPITCESGAVEYQVDIFESAWRDGAELRRSGKLLELGEHVQCPVVAIHGDYDPHPAEGVEKPLSATLKSFRFFLLERCGHKPWIERAAREEFFRLLKAELR